MTPVALQIVVPGVQELLIIALNFVLLAGVVYAVVLLGRRLVGGASDERVEELEARVEELESRQDSRE